MQEKGLSEFPMNFNGLRAKQRMCEWTGTELA